jgi:hypothetical protein
MISPREKEEEEGMWTLERKSLFANKALSLRASVFGQKMHLKKSLCCYQSWNSTNIFQFQTDLFFQMISPREVGEEEGMWTLERKSLFSNKIHAQRKEAFSSK